MHPVLSLVNYKRAISNCEWREWEIYKHMDRMMAASHGLAPLPSYAYISMLLPTTPLMQKHAITRITERFKDIQPVRLLDKAANKPRVGYIGSKLDADHVSGLLFSHLFPAHNTEDFDVYVFLTKHGGDNDNARRLYNTPGIQVFTLHEMNDLEAAEFIRDQNIDLLISTDGWNDEPRPGIVAHHPARKQAWWQGTATTSAAPWMDYIFIDEIIDDQEPGWRTEEAYHIPDCFYVAGHVKHPAVAATPTRQSVGVPQDKFVFSCLNGAQKLTPDIWADWMSILRQCPNSVLWLLEPVERTKENLLKQVPPDIDKSRIVFAAKTDKWTHIERAGVADVFLDTYYNGAHTTLAESLWMNVPAITLIGNTMSSRIGYSMLNSVGLPELAVKTREDYIRLAVQFYNEPSTLDGLKHRLIDTKHQSAIFDMRKQAEAVERFVTQLRQTA